MGRAPQKVKLDGSTQMRRFAERQTASRLADLSQQAERVGSLGDADSIHDLRVGIRRFSQALLLFSGLLPKKEVKKIRKKLREVMKLTSEVRNRDIAMEHLAGSDSTALKAELQTERDRHASQVQETVAKWRERDFGTRWSACLELDAK